MFSFYRPDLIVTCKNLESQQSLNYQSVYVVYFSCMSSLTRLYFPIIWEFGDDAVSWVFRCPEKWAKTVAENHVARYVIYPNAAWQKVYMY